MNKEVTYHVEDGVGIIEIDNPPVNALGYAVRVGLIDAIAAGEADAAAHVLLIIGAGRTFPAGADIREFGGVRRRPNLGDVIERIETATKLTVAAIHGTALGGGMEITLGCDYRIALATAKMGLPEVNLGLLPGAGGTQRLPRLIGTKAALDIIIDGKPVMAPQLKEMGVIDEVVADDLRAHALAYARKLVADGAPPRPVGALDIEDKNPEVFANFKASIARTKRGFLAPLYCIEAVKVATEMDIESGLLREREMFTELVASPQSAAQRHVFFAEREAAKIPGISKDTIKREIKQVGIIGAGTMGAGIAINFLDAGIPVTLLEMKQESLDRGLEIIRKNYEASQSKGRINSEQKEKCLSLISTTLSYNDLSDVDLVIEAVFENMDVKKQVFGELDRVCKQGAILATNTSTLNINEIAAATSRPEDVVGMHFFSPANIMKLLENVRGEKTSNEVIATVMALAKRIGKVGILVGVCYGFVGNRILHKRQEQAVNIVNKGATPADVDKVLYDYGFPMGPFAMWDLAGLDVGYRIRQGLRETDPVNAPARYWLDELVEGGRYGQKTQAGIFDYVKGDRNPHPSEVTAATIAKYRQEKGIKARSFSDEEIIERCLYVMVNEGARILDEGIAMRSLDIDIAWIYGYGFPKYLGGPMFWADQIGLDKVYAKVQSFYDETGEAVWKPSPLLERLASEGKRFADF